MKSIKQPANNKPEYKRRRSSTCVSRRKAVDPKMNARSLIKTRKIKVVKNGKSPEEMLLNLVANRHDGHGGDPLNLNETIKSPKKTDSLSNFQSSQVSKKIRKSRIPRRRPVVRANKLVGFYSATRIPATKKSSAKIRVPSALIPLETEKFYWEKITGLKFEELDERKKFEESEEQEMTGESDEQKVSEDSDEQIKFEESDEQKISESSELSPLKKKVSLPICNDDSYFDDDAGSGDDTDGYNDDDDEFDETDEGYDYDMRESCLCESCVDKYEQRREFLRQLESKHWSTSDVLKSARYVNSSSSATDEEEEEEEEEEDESSSSDSTKVFKKKTYRKFTREVYTSPRPKPRFLEKKRRYSFLHIIFDIIFWPFVLFRKAKYYWAFINSFFQLLY